MTYNGLTEGQIWVIAYLLYNTNISPHNHKWYLSAITKHYRTRYVSAGDLSRQWDNSFAEVEISLESMNLLTLWTRNNVSPRRVRAIYSVSHSLTIYCDKIEPGRLKMVAFVGSWTALNGAWRATPKGAAEIKRLFPAWIVLINEFFTNKSSYIFDLM